MNVTLVFLYIWKTYIFEKLSSKRAQANALLYLSISLLSDSKQEKRIDEHAEYSGAASDSLSDSICKLKGLRHLHSL
jgi:hypothetical protein